MAAAELVAGPRHLIGPPRRPPAAGWTAVGLAALLLLPAAPARPAPGPSAGPNPRGEVLLYEPNSTVVRPQGSAMWAATLSPDGKTLATAHGVYQGRGEVRIWDRAAGTVRHSIPFEKGVRAVAFSPDGKVLVSSCFDGAVRFHDPATGVVRAVGDESSGGHRRDGVNGIAFFKEGKYLATAGFDNAIRVWDAAAVVAAGRAAGPARVSPVAVFEGHTQRVLSVSGSADGRTLLSGSIDKTARAWDVPDPLPKMGEKPVVVKKERALLGGHTNGVEAIAVSPDGKLLVTGAWGGTLLIRDRDGKPLLNSQFQAGLMCAAFSRDGKYLAAGTGVQENPNAKEVRVWEVDGLKEVAYRADFADGVKGLEFTPDGKTLVVATTSQTVHLWPWAAPKDRQTLAPPRHGFTPQPLLAAAVSPDGAFLAFSGESKSVFVYDRAGGKLVAELTAHADVVPGLAFSPDGKTLATASYDKTVRLWDTATWTDRRTLTGHTGWVFGVAFSPDGKQIATASYDKSVRLWDAASGEQKATWAGHTAGVRSVAFDPAGKWVVSGGSDRVARIWDVTEGAVRYQLKGHKGAIRSVAFSPDGKTVATGSEDRTVKLWDAATGKELRAFPVLPDMVTAVRFSPKGQTLAAATFAGPVVVLDPLTGRRRQTLAGHSETTTAVAFADEGRALISVSLDQAIREWAAAKPAPEGAATLTARGAPVTAAAVTPDGRLVVLGGADGALSAWVLSGVEIAPLPHQPPPGTGPVTRVAVSADRVAVVGANGSVVVLPLAAGGGTRWAGPVPGRDAAFSPDGKHLAVANGKDVVLYDAATGKPARALEGGHDGPVRCVAFSPDGRALASAGDDARVRLWDAASGERKQASAPLVNELVIAQLAFSPDGARLALAVTGPDGPTPPPLPGMVPQTAGVYVLRLPDQTRVDPETPLPAFQPPLTANDGQEITAVVWTGRRELVATSADGQVRAWDTDGARQVRAFRGHDAAVTAAVVTTDGSNFLITAGEDMTVRRWQTPGAPRTPGVVRLTPPGSGKIWSAAFTPDGKYLISAGAGDKAVRVFRAPPAELPVVFPTNLHGVLAAAYSPDQKLLATGHDSGYLLLWDPATGKQVGSLSLPPWEAGPADHKGVLTGWVHGLAFTPDGKSLVAVGGDVGKRDQPGGAVVFDVAARKVRHRLTGHAGLLWQVAVSPDGALAAAGCEDGTVRVWEVETGKPVRTLTHGKAVRAVAFSPDGANIVSGGFDSALQLWDAGTGKREAAFGLPNCWPNAVAFSPDGRELVAATQRNVGRPGNMTDCLLYAFRVDIPGGRPRELKGHTGAVLSLAFLRDGKTLISGGGREGEFGELLAWDLPAGQPLGEFRGHRSWVLTVAVAPDGRTVASGAGGTGRPGELRQWDAAGFRPEAVVPTAGDRAYFDGAALSPDGKLFVLGGWPNYLAAWDTTDPARPVLKKQLAGHADGVRSVAFSPDGKRFVTADNAGMVKVWDAATLAPVLGFQASERPIYRAKFTPDGASFVTVGGTWPQVNPGEIRVWDARTGKEADRFPDQPRFCLDVAFLDGGKRMVTTQGTGGGAAPLVVWDLATKQVVPVPIPREALVGARSLDVSPDGKYLAVGTGGPVRVFEIRTWREVLAATELRKVAFRVAFAPDGKTLAVASEDSATIVLRVPTE